MDGERLAALYQEYTTTVSTPEMAISLELAMWLVEWWEKHKPMRILDLGSGFSSVVFAGFPDAEIWTVDTEQDWLDATEDFINEHRLDRHNHFMGHWQAMIPPSDLNQFDLVLVDIGHDGFRVRNLRKLASYCKPGGTIVFDDAHRTRYQATLWRHGELNAWKGEALEQTIDEFGRFAMMAEVPELPPTQDKVRVVVAVARERFWLDEATWWLAALAGQGWPMIKLGYTRKDLACELFAWHLLDNPQFTHVLMLDMDHDHPHDIVKRLGRHVLEDRGKWVVGGLNHRRCPPYEPCAYWRSEEGTHTPSHWTPELQSVDLLGGASVLIAREVFETIEPPWFGYDYNGADRRHYPGTDVSFSDRCLVHDIKQWVDPTVCSPHYRLEKVDMAYYHKWLAEHQDEIREDGTMLINKGVAYGSQAQKDTQHDVRQDQARGDVGRAQGICAEAD